MKEKENWLSDDDSRIGPPPKREWYGEERARRALTYTELVKFEKSEIDKHHWIIVTASMLAVTASVIAVGVWLAVTTDKWWVIMCSIPVAIALSLVFFDSLLNAWARVKAYFDFHHEPHSFKLSFKQTFKFRNQNDSI